MATHYRLDEQHHLLSTHKTKFQLPKGHFLFTSESVSAGHPDKLCDFISDSILDACLDQDPNSKVACESACKNSLVMVFGEITTNAQVPYETIVREAIKNVGYDNISKGLDYKNASIIVSLDQQSREINQAVVGAKHEDEIGAGDQGLMIGYASDETPELMPLTHHLCNKLIARLQECREKEICPWMRPDAKVQVTVEYKRDGATFFPVRIHNVLISQQHDEKITHSEIQAELHSHVLKHVLPQQYVDEHTQYHLNPSKAFTVGGPYGDAGLTGRKIIVDTYGGWGGHGGGAFSGKDPTKVDRSAAYAARWVAKSLVASKLCKRVMIQVAYGIGISEPLSISVNSYGTHAEGYDDDDLSEIVQESFDLRPGVIIRELQLRRPIYAKTASGGHFGRTESEFLWEKPRIIDIVAWKANKEQQQQQK
ncbi:unnamed protein product (macronuclear) [Paramecium tetraurelia]|uniref:S-adenosylmethionine synthase n=1 Tax=Paramecium tetraurelia TaxID=5888 RepID=A0BJ39_PARTE|nr:uncharacterized protein GSPATT00004929001 [Paramecium tetraurelia]CAK58556.1 unnamed protein product [Paramecium tetraurelia]|eukprot:XP_001425954.1 hypothetical protein (macronuclear) [Paramecium tetraurelia strain d4-2]